MVRAQRLKSAQLLPVFSPPQTGEAPATLLDGLAYYYPLGEAAPSYLDASGHGPALSAAGSGAPGRKNGYVGYACRLVRANGQYLSCSDHAALRSGGNHDFTIACRLYLNTVGGYMAGIVGKWLAGAKEYLLWWNNGKLQFNVTHDGSTSVPVAQEAGLSVALQTWYNVRAWHDAANDQIGLQVDGGPKNTVTHAAGVYQGTAGFKIGVITATDCIDGRVESVAKWDRLLSDEEWAYFRYAPYGRDYPFPAAPALRRKLVFDGASHTVGAGASAEMNFPEQLVERLGPGYDKVNLASAGQTVNQMSSDAAAQIDPQYDNNRPLNVLVAWAGSNDIAAGDEAGTLANDIGGYCTARRAAGFRVVVGTIIPRGTFTGNAMETNRLLYNTWLRENYSDFADGLADFCALPAFDQAGDENDATYYSADKIHLTDAGYSLIAQAVQPVVAGLA